MRGVSGLPPREDLEMGSDHLTINAGVEREDFEFPIRLLDGMQGHSPKDRDAEGRLNVHSDQNSWQLAFDGSVRSWELVTRVVAIAIQTDV